MFHNPLFIVLVHPVYKLAHLLTHSPACADPRNSIIAVPSSAGTFLRRDAVSLYRCISSGERDLFD